MIKENHDHGMCLEPYYYYSIVKLYFSKAFSLRGRVKKNLFKAKKDWSFPRFVIIVQYDL